MPEQQLSITDFITDGSLIRLCEVVAQVVDAPVTLRAVDGRAIVGLDEGRVVVADSRAGAASAAVAPAEFAAPLVVDAETIGTITISARSGAGGASPAGAPIDRAVVERFLALLASTVSEVCQRELEQRRRAEELQSLYKLSSLLVGVGMVETMLRAGLAVAIDALEAEGGVVRLINDATAQLEISAEAAADASHGAPGSVDAPCPEWASCFDEAHDDAALAGDVVCAHACGGVVASAGMIFRARPLGVLSLRLGEGRTLSAVERGLLQSISQQLAAAVANGRLVEAETEARRVGAQMKLAADVQRRMLPREIPEPPNLDMAARYAPCFDLGGDFYDLFDLGGHVGIVVGDVVGKGVAAALLMAHVRASLRAHARDVYDLDEVIRLTNEALCRDTLSNEFATLFYGVIDPRTLRLTYCNAGHEPPLIAHRPESGPPTLANLSELTTGGMVVGVDPSQRYQRASIDLRPGDVMLAYTDGLAEAMNFENQKFGAKRIRQALLEILRIEPDASAKRIAQHVHWQMRNFAGLNTRLDDTTLVAVRVVDSRQ